MHSPPPHHFHWRMEKGMSPVSGSGDSVSEDPKNADECGDPCDASTNYEPTFHGISLLCYDSE